MKLAFFILIILFVTTFHPVSVAGQKTSTTPQISETSPNPTPTPQMTTVKPTPSSGSGQLLGMIQSLQQRLDLLNTTLASGSLFKQVANNSRQVSSLVTRTTGKWAGFQAQLANLSSKIEQLEETAVTDTTPPSTTQWEQRLSSLEDNLGKITATLRSNSTSGGTANPSGIWVHNYSVWVSNFTGGKGPHSPSNGGPSPSCNCNCGRKNKFIFG